MVNVRLHPGDGQNPPSGGGDAAPSGHPSRLNLLLSYAGWQPDPWVNRLPRLLEPMGITSFQVHTGREASDVIRRIQIHIAVVDLGLPLDATCTQDGAASPELTEGGTRILELLRRLDQPPPTVVVKRARTHCDARREMAAALKLGAFAVVDRPIDSADLNAMLDVMRRVLLRFHQGRWPSSPPNTPPSTPTSTV